MSGRKEDAGKPLSPEAEALRQEFWRLHGGPVPAITAEMAFREVAALVQPSGAAPQPPRKRRRHRPGTGAGRKKQ
jgi:hypothetical protein